MELVFVLVFVCALLAFAWSRAGLPKNIDKWKADAINCTNPLIFFLRMQAIYKYRPWLAVSSFIVCGATVFAFIVWLSMK